MKAIIRFFSSVRLAIVLIILLVAASILGTLIPQGRDAAEYAARYGRLAETMVRLQFTDLYRSVWFLGLSGLFGLNIVVCTLTRLGAKVRRVWRPKIESDPKALAAGRIKDKVRLNVGAAEAKGIAVTALSAARYRVKVVEEAGAEGTASGGKNGGGGVGGRIHVLGRKGVEGIFGSDAVHLGLLVIIAGGIVTAAGGFRTDLGLNAGKVLDVPRAGFALRLDKFETETYPDGNVKDWKSTLTVIENGRDVRTQVIEVNHPLVHHGFSFYQSAYGFDWDDPTLEFRIGKRSEAGPGRTMKIRVGEKTALGDMDRTELVVRRFIPDFVLGKNNAPGTRSDQPNNPAALIEGWSDGRKVIEGWVFAAYPNIARLRGEAAADWTIELRNVDAPQFSVIQAAKDPGVPLIWLGCFLVMAGLFLAFYRPTWEIRMTLENAGASAAGAGAKASQEVVVGSADGTGSGRGANKAAETGASEGREASVETGTKANIGAIASNGRSACTYAGKTEITAGGTAAKSRERFEAEFVRVIAGLRRSK
ncbi:MAG: cytochrome c biogenesis protein ResB [Candidatus Aminicenantes bacterium]|nr:cytochrome c biogenesis protein ResB [Candidatus Aminicenantes bacterium]